MEELLNKEPWLINTIFSNIEIFKVEKNNIGKYKGVFDKCKCDFDCLKCFTKDSGGHAGNKNIFYGSLSSCGKPTDFKDLDLSITYDNLNE